jgi:hypothetical protein
MYALACHKQPSTCQSMLTLLYFTLHTTSTIVEHCITLLLCVCYAVNALSSDSHKCTPSAHNAACAHVLSGCDNTTTCLLTATAPSSAIVHQSHACQAINTHMRTHSSNAACAHACRCILQPAKPVQAYCSSCTAPTLHNNGALLCNERTQQCHSTPEPCKLGPATHMRTQRQCSMPPTCTKDPAANQLSASILHQLHSSHTAGALAIPASSQ